MQGTGAALDCLTLRWGEQRFRDPDHHSISPFLVVSTSLASPSPRSTAAYIGLTSPGPGYAMESLVGGAADYAHALYDFFRQCDRAGVTEIDCQWPSTAGIGRALQDRIRRAEAASGAQRGLPGA